MSEPSLYAAPRVVTDINQCYFYHTMDLPGYGRVKGEWDLRGTEAQYLGGISLEGKRVLEVGTASGFLCFYMEKQGAQVVAYDLSPDQQWDIVPYSKLGDAQYRQGIKDRKEVIARLNNGYWLAHRVNQSQAKVVYGSVYEIPPGIGEVDISVFGSVLLHLRDPLLALQRAAKLTRETVVVTDTAGPLRRLDRLARGLGRRLPAITFRPNYKVGEPTETWWNLSPSFVERVLGMLGFENMRTTYARYRFLETEVELYTVVARRT